MVQFSLAEPPSVIECLLAGTKNGIWRNYFELMEGESVNTTCLIDGMPKPFLQCYLLNEHGMVENGQITSKESFTKPIARRLQFHNVSRKVTKVECEIDGRYGRKKTYARDAVVYCKCKIASKSFLSRYE